MREPGGKPTISFALAYVLLLAQWTGFGMVLCVSGAGHVSFELMNAACCASEAPRGAELAWETGGTCAGCTDMDLQNASLWDPPRQASVTAPDTASAAAAVLLETAAETVRRPSATHRSILAAPLRC